MALSPKRPVHHVYARGARRSRTAGLLQLVRDPGEPRRVGPQVRRVVEAVAAVMNLKSGSSGLRRCFSIRLRESPVSRTKSSSVMPGEVEGLPLELGQSGVSWVQRGVLGPGRSGDARISTNSSSSSKSSDV